MSASPNGAFNAPGQGVYIPEGRAAITKSRAAVGPTMGAGKKAKLEAQKKALREKLAREQSIKKQKMDEELRRQQAKRDEHLATMTQTRNQKRVAGSIDKFMYKDGVNDILEKLEKEMIGLQEVKNQVRAIASLLVIDKMRIKLGLQTSIPSLHMCFTGAPGTGKTTIALRMGQILQRMGYCRMGHVVVATRDDLVGQYVGHTAPKTKEAIKKALGGILFVDEAYYLYDEENEKDYGSESCAILESVMETMQEDLICIYAGYKDLMDHFFSGVPGIKTRIGNHIDFPNYQETELLDIARVMLDEAGWKMTQEAEGYFQEYIEERKKLPFFANARSVRNVIDQARTRAAVRTYMEVIKPIAGEQIEIPADTFNTIDAKDMPTIDELKEKTAAGVTN